MTDTTTTIIARRTRGTRRLLGMDWPVEDMVIRVQCPSQSRPYWRAVWGLCCQCCTRDERYTTRRAALEAIDLRLGEGMEEVTS